MATNRRKVQGRKLRLTCSHPATPASGGPVRIGEMTGVALTDEDAAGETVVDTAGVYALVVKGINGGGNVAVAPGDVLTYTDADTPPISAKVVGATARKVGYALEAVTSGATTTILVKLTGG